MDNIAESKLQSLCFMWHWNTYPDERMRLYMNHNNAKNRIEGAILKGMGLIAGVADMSFLRSDGRIVYIELKIKGGRQSKAQREFENMARANNAFYFIAYNLDQFQKIIKIHQ